MTTWGLIGSGHIGSTVARLAVAVGHDVVLSTSRGPKTLADLVAALGPRARATTAEEVVRTALDEIGYDVVDLGPHWTKGAKPANRDAVAAAALRARRHRDA